jgi:hypothetical protein
MSEWVKTSQQNLTNSGSIFKPFDLVPFYDRPDVEDKLHSLNQAIQGIYEHWTDYYGM